MHPSHDRVAPFPAIIEEPARQIPVIANVDVLVAGGGPAGIAAAIAAARQGARTLLVERYGYLGGMITGANVTAILGMGDGYGVTVGGIMVEIRERLARLGAITPLRDGIEYRVDNETFKWQAVEMLQEAGADLLLQTLTCYPILREGQVAGAFVESKSGRQAILAQVTVDCTADADLAYRAGCPCDDATHVVTLVARTEGVDHEKVKAYAEDSPNTYQAIMEEAKRRNGGTAVGSPRYLANIDVADAAALTRAEIQLRREAFETLNYLKAGLPGYEQARISITFPQFGVRQGRRVRGEYTLTDDDLRASRHFADGIARLGVYFPDWGPTYVIKGLHYDVPYRCLVPEGVEGLLVAGRCVSSDYATANSMRLIVPCFATGQAAGTAAAIAVEVDCAPRRVPVDTLRQALRQQHVVLGVD